MSHLNFFHLFQCLSYWTCLVTLFDRKLHFFFKNSSNWPFFGIFNKLLSTQNVNVARFARNVEWDSSVIFKHCVLKFRLCRLIWVHGNNARVPARSLALFPTSFVTAEYLEDGSGNSEVMLNGISSSENVLACKVKTSFALKHHCIWHIHWHPRC